MSPAWKVEWKVAFRRRRLLALNLLVPLALVAPVALAGAPAAHAAGVYSVLFVLFGVFGSAIPLVRDGSSGILTRWKLAGLTPARLLAGRLAAQAGLDLLEALPATVVIVASAAGSAPRTGLPLLGALLFALLVGNAVGAWAAALARSLAEAALFAAVGSLLLLHAAGVFRTPAPRSWGAALERISPFRVLHEVLLEAAGGAAAAPLTWAPALAVGVLILALTWALAGTLVGSLLRSREA